MRYLFSRAFSTSCFRHGLFISLLASLLAPTMGSAEEIVTKTIGFEDWTQRIGLNYQGPTWGAAWRDYNGDGYADFFVSHHFTFPPGSTYDAADKLPAGLYANQAGATVLDVGPTALGKRPGDWHGGTWVDFDNDGDADLFVSRGGFSGTAKDRLLTQMEKLLSGNLLFVQENGNFIERGEDLGLAPPGHRGRRSSWFDIDDDGRLDALLGQADPGEGESVLFLQRDAGFEPCVDALRTDAHTANKNPNVVFIFPGFAGDQRHVQLGSGPGNLFKQQDRPCQFEAVPNAPDVKPAWLFDALIADLDGDLSLDQVGVSRGTTASLEQGMRYFRLELPGAAEASDFQFRIAGGANLSVRPAVGSMGWLKPEGSSVYLGKSGAAPEASQFALDPENPELLGPYDAAGRDHGVFIGYDPGTEIWSVLVKKSHPQNVTIDARAEGGVEVLGAPSIRSSPPLTGKAVAYVQGAEGWVNAPTTMGLDEVDQSCVSVVAADLDNDMDMDLFMACGDTARNQDNVLLVNDGGRYVHTVTDVKPEQTGLVDAVSTGDFDRDGFPDLLITNGASLDSDRSGHGYTQLWRNRGNGNKWANGSVERFPGPAINAEADLTQGSGTIVSAPLLLTGKQVASRGENVHFLLLCATVMDCDVRGWDIDGERLDTTRRSLDYVFNTAGAKTVAATVNLASGKALRIATEITIPP